MSSDYCGFACRIDAIAGYELSASCGRGVVHDATEMLFGTSCEQTFEHALVTSPCLPGSQRLDQSTARQLMAKPNLCSGHHEDAGVETLRYPRSGRRPQRFDYPGVNFP